MPVAGGRPDYRQLYDVYQTPIIYLLDKEKRIVAKKLTRNQVSLKDWNKNWHDHTIEIASGRVQVLDLPPDKAKEVADPPPPMG